MPQHDEFGTCKIRVFFGFAQKRLALPSESKKIQNPVPEPALNGDSGDKDGLSTDLSYPHSDFMLKKLIGEKIRSIRNKKNLPLLQLSQITGQQTSYLTEVELGKRNLSIDSLEKIMDALNIKPGNLLDFREIDPDSQEFETRTVLEVHYQFLLGKKSEDVKMIHKITTEIFKSIDAAARSE